MKTSIGEGDVDRDRNDHKNNAMNRNNKFNNIYSKYNHRYNKSTRYKIPFQQYESCKTFSDKFCSHKVLGQSKPVQIW
jgi:hypothetical protein